jgi:hypothetical protein
MFSACSDSGENVAVLIYTADDVNNEKPIASINWDDKNKLIIINQMLNEMYDTAGQLSTDIEMSYIIELVNSGSENDVFAIGFDGDGICGNGKVQGVTIDDSYTKNITVDDFNTILSE